MIAVDTNILIYANRAGLALHAIAQAIEFLDRLLGSPPVRVLGPGSRHWELLRAVLGEGQA